MQGVVYGVSPAVWRLHILLGMCSCVEGNVGLCPDSRVPGVCNRPRDLAALNARVLWTKGPEAYCKEELME